jgi:hypothetical protein
MDRLEGLPVIDVDEGENIKVAVRADDLLEGDTADPKRHRRGAMMKLICIVAAAIGFGSRVKYGHGSTEKTVSI